MRPTMQRFLTPAAAVLLLTLLALPALARPPHGRGGGGPGHGAMGGFLGGMIADHLELSEAQREEIRGLLDAAHENSASLWSELRESRDALMDASAAEPFDEASVRAAAARLADAEAEVAIHRAGVIAQVRGVLTPEQQVQAEAFHERMRERREEFRGHHRGHGGGGWGDVD